MKPCRLHLGNAAASLLGSLGAVAQSFFIGALLVLAASSFAQQKPFLFHVTFRGTSYETNATGEVMRKQVTDKTILEDIARPVNITDLSSIALVYHIRGSDFGDTIDVVNATTGATMDTVFGFFFGSDLSLGRMALTNTAGTQERRVDQVYTKQSPYALGSAFITKRYLTDTAGNARATFDGDMHYLVRPQGTDPARFVIGSFTSTRPFQAK